jgi:NAD(P)-dependent dehydrogenase (short-subunit alcohol dehydrogenase family)
VELGLEGKVAVVTGASRGIGGAIARELAREGCAVAIAARSGEALDVLAGELGAVGSRVLAHAADLREADEPARLVEATVAAFGGVDVVVANAGTTKRGDFLALSDEDWQDGFALKLFAHVRLIRAAWPHLVATGGSVLSIAGVGGRTPGAEFAIGGSVNAAILSLAKALAARGVADGVRVNVVNPGPIRTERLRTRIRALADSAGVDEEEASGRLVADLGVTRFGEPEDVAALVAFVVSSRGGFLHGALIDVDGGQTRTI